MPEGFSTIGPEVFLPGKLVLLFDPEAPEWCLIRAKARAGIRFRGVRVAGNAHHFKMDYDDKIFYCTQDVIAVYPDEERNEAMDRIANLWDHYRERTKAARENFAAMVRLTVG